MKKKFKNLKSGQKVWSYQFGKGTVLMVSSEKVYVDFIDNNVSPPEKNCITYNFTGRIADRDRMPDLYLKKPVITTKKRLSYLNAESFGKGMMDGEHLERLFSENINLSEVVEKVLSMASEHVMESEGSDFGIYMLKHQISDHIKGQFITAHTMKPSKK